MGQQGFWDVEQRYEKLEQKQDLLVRLGEIIPWQEFRELLEQVHEKPRKSNAGRKPIEVLILFKLLILQQLYNISDESLEYQVNDRLSFMRFLNLGIEDSVPDATTLWLFRQQLTDKGLIEPLFERFDEYLREQGYQAEGGQIVDATLIPVPKARHRREENEQIKQGEIPPEWQDKPHRLAQKDTDARWTQKNGASHFGYKDHISIDTKYGFIRRYAVTDAAVHDSKMLGAVLDNDNSGDELWADGAYRSAAIEAVLELLQFDSRIHERGYRNHPLTEDQKESNREKSKTRAKVEHVFGNWVMTMGGKLLRCIGKPRATAQLGLKNLVYNFKRYVFWQSQPAD
jgi:IS5 family transposase